MLLEKYHVSCLASINEMITIMVKIPKGRILVASRTVMIITTINNLEGKREG